MNKFFGKIGYSVMIQTAPGVNREKLIERDYYGDVIRNTSQHQNSDTLNDNVNISNEIIFMGAKWKITNIEVQYPRLILTVGGVYNGSANKTA